MVARNLALFPLFLCPQPIRIVFVVFRSKLILPCNNVEKRYRFFHRPKSNGVITYWYTIISPSLQFQQFVLTDEPKYDD